MTIVNFYDQAADELLRFAVIITTYQGKWVFCKHRERETLEIPGGHREAGERVDAAAKRELYEETGAIDYEITPIEQNRCAMACQGCGAVFSFTINEKAVEKSPVIRYC